MSTNANQEDRPFVSINRPSSIKLPPLPAANYPYNDNQVRVSNEQIFPLVGILFSFVFVLIYLPKTSLFCRRPPFIDTLLYLSNQLDKENDASNVLFAFDHRHSIETMGSCRSTHRTNSFMKKKMRKKLFNTSSSFLVAL